ncbi:MAG: chemotaxis protein CheW [Deltaproteobacteria bacterium]|nr:chemotaxis protein CheW [Deltaproteobacteria bacterium]
MAELRNVIVFTIGGVRYAVELRWVREVVSLGFVTAVPTAPTALGGVCNLHGTILPVLDVAAVLGQAPGPPARQGDGALVLETEGVVCALRVDQVDHVASLHESGGAIVDAGGRPLTLLDPGMIVRRALEMITTVGTAEPQA